MHLDGSQTGFGRPQVSSRPGPPSSGKLTGASKVLSSDESCVARPFALISRASLYVRHTSGSFMHFSLCSLVFSPVFQLWVPADQNSPKHVELMRFNVLYPSLVMKCYEMLQRLTVDFTT